MRSSKHGSSWHDDLTLTRHNADTTAESRLWRKCLIRAIYDAAYGSPERRHGILEWIDHDDFEIVCDFAYANADYIHKSIYAILCAPRVARIVLASQLKSAIYSKDNDQLDEDL